MKPLEEMGKFKTVVIDPPWASSGFLSRDRSIILDEPYIIGDRVDWRGSSHKAFDYETMELEGIADMPLRAVLDDDAFVFLWTINRFVRDAFDILEAWGLRYRFQMAWHKPNGPKPVGFPTYNTEFILCGSVGKPQFLDTRDFRTANIWDAPPAKNFLETGWGRQIENCSKPEGFYDLLRRVTPAPRLDIFGRRRIAGFHSWGDEAPEGEPLPDHYQQVLLEA